MEQFYEITNESEHYEEYYKRIERANEQRDELKKFTKEFGIIGEDFFLHNGCLCVSADNLAIFPKDYFKVNPIEGNGTEYYVFKKNSSIGIALSESGITSVRMPFVPSYFHGATGRVHTNLFNVKDRIYCSIELFDMVKPLDCPVGFVEIKASAFYMAMEEGEKNETCQWQQRI